MYKAVDLAKYIVTKCVNDGHPISNLQLQKILYYIQKDFLKNGKVAFSENIEAWNFGPVVPAVYYEFCGFGSMPIRTRYMNTSVSFEDVSLIDTIVDEKRMLNPWDLVEETHKANGAWYEVYHQKGRGSIIPMETIIAKG